ncbi:hypothetical protein DUNSADRAFT_15102 [Dunaliella salina]|uniref:Uncharacterized protein n=1 Tax=Dunaliella salina TaxID=3046 RepID=A0ABQ7H218_DUNSA|nr:hypothetical protein DUNSADRAFT_15102 [Dunaliella salina]|eukprot:KAF5840902.1 hypothetical protein DUNSADRAFT_15102 [Dunaliella salina]
MQRLSGLKTHALSKRGTSQGSSNPREGGRSFSAIERAERWQKNGKIASPQTNTNKTPEAAARKPVLLALEDMYPKAEHLVKQLETSQLSVSGALIQLEGDVSAALHSQQLICQNSELGRELARWLAASLCCIALQYAVKEAPGFQPYRVWHVQLRRQIGQDPRSLEAGSLQASKLVGGSLVREAVFDELLGAQGQVAEMLTRNLQHGVPVTQTLAKVLQDVDVRVQQRLGVEDFFQLALEQDLAWPFPDVEASSSASAQAMLTQKNMALKAKAGRQSLLAFIARDETLAEMLDEQALGLVVSKYR